MDLLGMWTKLRHSPGHTGLAEPEWGTVLPGAGIEKLFWDENLTTMTTRGERAEMPIRTSGGKQEQNGEAYGVKRGMEAKIIPAQAFGI